MSGLRPLYSSRPAVGLETRSCELIAGRTATRVQTRYNHPLVILTRWILAGVLGTLVLARFFLGSVRRREQLEAMRDELGPRRWQLMLLFFAAITFGFAILLVKDCE